MAMSGATRMSEEEGGLLLVVKKRGEEMRIEVATYSIRYSSSSSIYYCQQYYNIKVNAFTMNSTILEGMPIN